MDAREMVLNAAGRLSAGSERARVCWLVHEEALSCASCTYNSVDGLRNLCIRDVHLYGCITCICVVSSIVYVSASTAWLMFVCSSRDSVKLDVLAC